MTKNKALLLCTTDLSPLLVDAAAKRDVLIDVFPFIQVKTKVNEKLNEQISRLSLESHTAVFTSVNAVKSVIEKLKLKPDWKIYCTSGTTRKLVSEYFGSSAIKDTENDALLLAEKIIADAPGKIIFFCGDHRRDELPAKLAAHHIPVNEIIVYETSLTPKKVSKNYNGVLFFSPSAVSSFFSVNEIEKDTLLFAIGHTTANAIPQYCQNKIIVSESPLKETLVNNCVAYFQKHPIQ